MFSAPFSRLFSRPLSRVGGSLRNRARALFRPRTLGEQGERLAARYLRKKSYIIIAHSRRDQFGEIDLIAVDSRTVVFVEVKTRRSDHRGRPADAVDLEKQQRLTRLALRFLKLHDLLENPARFDIIAITWPKGERKPTIEHFINAFEGVGESRMF